MPKSPVRAHDLSAIFVVVGTTHITEWGESGGCILKPNADAAEASVGAGGHVVISFSSDDHYTAELTVKRDSDAYALLQAERIAQRAGVRSGGLARLPFKYKDTISGEELSTDFAVFLMKPELPAEKAAAEATFTLFLNSPTHVLPS